MPPTSTTQSRSGTFRRRIILALVVIAAGAWAGETAYRVLKPRYRHWKAEKSLAEARGYVASRDLPKAELALRVAFQSGANGEAYQVLAELLESANSARAVEARRNVLRAEPGNLAAALALATTALKFGDTETARQALEACTDAEKGTPEYRRVAAIFSLGIRQPALADYFLTGVEKDSPNDKSARLLHDGVLLNHPDPAKAQAARTDLAALSEDKDLRLSALHLLLDDAFHQKDRNRVRDVGLKLESTSGASFGDLLSVANAQIYVNSNRLPDPALAARIADGGRGSPTAALQYVQWLLLQHRGADADAWVNSLPADLRANPVVHSLRAAIAAARLDWPGLRTELAAGAWGPLTPAAVDFAFSARTILVNGQRDLARKTWAAAIAEVQASDASLRALVRLARLWRWKDADRDALYALVHAAPGASENYPPLVTLLRVGKESIALQEVFSLWHAALPELQAARYNWALLTLLVAPSALPSEAGKALQDLHAVEPHNAFYATGCALALLQLGKANEACAVADRISSPEKALPARAPYLALIYASGRRLDDARAAIHRAPRAQDLLPEEAAMLVQAAALCAG